MKGQYYETEVIGKEGKEKKRDEERGKKMEGGRGRRREREEEGGREGDGG